MLSWCGCLHKYEHIYEHIYEYVYLMDRNYDRCCIRIGLPCRRLTKNSLDAVIILVQTGKKQPGVDWKTQDIYYIKINF